MAQNYPEALARRLFGWEMRTSWDSFYGAVDAYASVLAACALPVFRFTAKKFSSRPKGGKFPCRVTLREGVRAFCDVDIRTGKDAGKVRAIRRFSWVVTTVVPDLFVLKAALGFPIGWPPCSGTSISEGRLRCGGSFAG